MFSSFERLVGWRFLRASTALGWWAAAHKINSRARGIIQEQRYV